MVSLFSSSLLLMICLALEADGQSNLPPGLNDEAVREAFRKAQSVVRQENQKNSPLPQRQGDAAVRQSFQQALSPRALDMDKNQAVFEEATRILAKRYGLASVQIAEGLPSLNLERILQDGTLERCRAAIAVNCSNVSIKYRTIDGSCNNLDHPTWGMASSCFNALTGAHFSDGISRFRLSISGSPLPNPRRVSLQLERDSNRPSTRHPHMFMLIGQFIAHDLSSTPASVDGSNHSINCCPVQQDAPKQCAPIEPPRLDPFYGIRGITCLNNVRASLCASCTLGPRSNTNKVSSYIDLSHVYGTSSDVASKHRAFDGSGSLKTTNHNGMTLLPKSKEPERDVCSYQNPRLKCFDATADGRVNQHPSLTSMHTVFVRYHNVLASSLRGINPHWNDERLYQEARRIAGAQFQMVVYGEYLPEVLSPDVMEEFGLKVKQSGYTKYDASQNPTMSPEFAGAAFRFGHATIDSFFARTSPSRNVSAELKDIFFFPFELYEGGVEEYIKGLAESRSQRFDRFATHDVTRHLYQERPGFLSFRSGLDLASTNIQRGRDIGLPPYIEMLRFCGGPRIQSFQDLDQIFRYGASEIFASLYESPEDIDLFPGGLAERPMANSTLGPTFSCILGMQFQRTKFGDRFYFEHGGQPGSFAPNQLSEIRKTRLSAILCQSSSIPKLQRNVLRYKSERNYEIDCNEFPKIDLTPWKD